jgi:hypothetical protein
LTASPSTTLASSTAPAGRAATLLALRLLPTLSPSLARPLPAPTATLVTLLPLTARTARPMSALFAQRMSRTLMVVSPRSLRLTRLRLVFLRSFLRVNRWPFELLVLIRKTVFVQLAVYIRCIMHLMLAVVYCLQCEPRCSCWGYSSLTALSRVSLLPVFGYFSSLVPRFSTVPPAWMSP